MKMVVQNKIAHNHYLLNFFYLKFKFICNKYKKVKF